MVAIWDTKLMLTNTHKEILVYIYIYTYVYIYIYIYVSLSLSLSLSSPKPRKVGVLLFSFLINVLPACELLSSFEYLDLGLRVHG